MTECHFTVGNFVFSQVINGQGRLGDPITVHDMSCSGEERHVSDCAFADHAAHAHACAGNERAGVRCRRTSKACAEHEWHCADRECVHVNNVCDGVKNCADGSDEDEKMCSQPLQVKENS